MVRIEADRQTKKTAFARPGAAGRNGRVDSKFRSTLSLRKDSEPAAPLTVSSPAFTKAWTTTLRQERRCHAANAGEVVLAAPLFYEGNCVIINHGQQFLTIYMHLSKLSVKEGDKVEKGQEVGLSGATGRATGPHLHVAVRWQGAYLDPAQLWVLPLPALPQAKDTAASNK